MRFGRRPLARAALGIAISLVASWLVLRSVDLASAADVLRTAIPAWIAVMFVTVFLDVASRGARWRVLLAPIEVIQSMARIEDSGGSRPAMISPLVTHGSDAGPRLPSSAQ